jgi:hypothetical protein
VEVLIMKKYLLFSVTLLVALSVGFSSCQSDDDDNIVGLWAFVNLTIDAENPQNPQLANEARQGAAFATILLQGTAIEFRRNGTFTFTVPMVDAFGGNGRIEGTYTYDRGRFTMTVDDETIDSDSMISEGSYVTLRDGVLTLVSDNLQGEYGHYYRADGFTIYTMRMTFSR